MTPSQKLARARNSVYAYCQQQFPGQTTLLHDAIYIRDGFYRGRRFRGPHVTAIWFAEEDVLKIHSLDGACLASWDEAEMDRRTQQPGPATLPMRAAEPQKPGAAQEPGAEPVRRAA